MKPVLMKLDLCALTISSSSLLELSPCLAAIIERIEKDRRASLTDKCLRRILPAREGEDIRTALTLAIDVDAADLVD